MAPQLVGIISIEYDQNTYLGSFDSFTWGYTEQAQNGGIEFSFEFTVSQMYDNAQSAKVKPMRSPTPSPSDPRYGAQGQAPNAGVQATNQIAPPVTMPQVVASFQQAAAAASSIAQINVPTSNKGFRLPAAPAVQNPDTVPIQPFFDPRRT